MTYLQKQYRPMFSEFPEATPDEVKLPVFIYQEAKQDAPRLMAFLNRVNPNFQIDNLQGVMCELIFTYFDVYWRTQLPDSIAENDPRITTPEFILASLAEIDPEFHGHLPIIEFWEHHDLFNAAQEPFVHDSSEELKSQFITPEFYPLFAAALHGAFFFPEEALPTILTEDPKFDQKAEMEFMRMYSLPELRHFIEGFFWRMEVQFGRIR